MLKAGVDIFSSDRIGLTVLYKWMNLQFRMEPHAIFYPVVQIDQCSKTVTEQDRTVHDPELPVVNGRQVASNCRVLR